MAHCYQLQSCGTTYQSLINQCSNTLLTAFHNKIIYFNTDPAKTYKLVYVGENTCLCSGFIDVPNMVDTGFTDCSEVQKDYFNIERCSGEGSPIDINIQGGVVSPINAPCGECPPGWTDLGDSCENVTSVPATLNGTLLTAQQGDQLVAYNSQPARVYQNITNANFPIVQSGTNTMVDQSSTTFNVIDNFGGAFWQNTLGTNGRLNTVGVWDGSISEDEWYGFAVCIDVPTTRNYTIGVSADNWIKVKLNGQEIIKMEQNGGYQFQYWHIFEIELEQGQNIIECEGYNTINEASFGFEVYALDYAGLVARNPLFLSDPNAIYFWTLFSTFQMIGAGVFQLSTENGYSCPPGYALDYCNEVGGVPVCSLIERQDQVDCEYPVLKLENYPCDCWQVLSENDETTPGDFQIVTDQFAECKDCSDDIGVCDNHERELAYAIRVQLPNPPEPDRGFKACCYDNIVLATLVGNKYEENDFNSFYFVKQTYSDDCIFKLERKNDGSMYFLNDDTYGEFWDFGDFNEQSEMTVIRVDWRNVLDLLGEGEYCVIKEQTIAGITFNEYSNTFKLRTFTHDIADQTVRLDSVMNGYLVKQDVDFKGTNFRTSLRTKGYFGNRNPKYIQDNLVDRDWESIQNTMSQENKYLFQTGLIPNCITDEIYDFMLFGNELYMNDYNKANHSYKYRKFAVELLNNSGGKYYVRERHARINLEFTDRFKDSRKKNC